MRHEQRMNMHRSMDHHGIKGAGISWFSLPVTLMESQNDYISYPAKGILRICEQGTDLSVIAAVFHHLKDDGSLGPSVEVRRPIFTYLPDHIPTKR